MTALPQLPVQIIQHDVGQDRRQRGTLRGPLDRCLPDPVDHHPGLQIAPDELEDVAVGYLARYPRHEDIELNPVEKPIQINIDDPLQTIQDTPPRNPHRLVGGFAGTKSKRRAGKERIEYRRKYLRKACLNRPTQPGSTPKQPPPPPGLGAPPPSDRTGP